MHRERTSGLEGARSSHRSSYQAKLNWVQNCKVFGRFKGLLPQSDAAQWRWERRRRSVSRSCF